MGATVDGTVGAVNGTVNDVTNTVNGVVGTTLPKVCVLNPC